MPVPIRARPIRSGAAVVLVLLVAACGTAGAAAAPLVTTLPPGQPAGTVTVGAGSDVAQVAGQIQDAIVATGGTVAAVLDHTAAARALGVDLPPSTVVVGGAAAAMLPLLRADQRAGANLPPRYLVREVTPGAVAVTYDGADYLAAVSGVPARDARDTLRGAGVAVIGRVAPGVEPPPALPLIGVTPADHLVAVFGSADVGSTVDRLRRAADLGGGRPEGAVDLAAGSGDPGPALRPTTVVLVAFPTTEGPLLAAAPSIGLDLPLRFVVWLDELNRTQIGHPDVRRIAARHGLAADDPNVARLAADADRLARLAAGIIE